MAKRLPRQMPGNGIGQSCMPFGATILPPTCDRDHSGGSVVVMKKTLVTAPARLSAAARTALVQKISASTHINFVEVGKLEIWDIELPQGSLDDW